MTLHLRGILGNTAWLSLLQLAFLLLPLLTTPVITRAFGPELFGFVVTATAVATYAALFIGYGFPWSGPRLVTRNRGDCDALSRNVSAILGAQLIIAAVAGLAYVAWSLQLNQSDELRLAQWAILASAIFNALVPAWLFLGLERMRTLVLPQVLLRLAATIAIVVMVRTPDDLLVYVSINALASLAGIAMFLRLMRRLGIRLRWPSLRRMRIRVCESSALFLSNVAISAYTTANVLIVSLLLGNAAAGIFGLADRLRQAAVGAFVPMTQAIYPFVCRTFGTTDALERLARQRMFQIMLLTAAGAGLAMFAVAPYAVELLGGAKFRDATSLVRIFSLVPLVVVTSNILGVQIMLPRGMDKTVTKIVSGSALTGVPLQLALTYRFGLIGSAWAYVLVEAIVAAGFTAALLSARKTAAAS